MSYMCYPVSRYSHYEFHNSYIQRKRSTENSFWLNALKALILALSVNVGYTSQNVTTHIFLRVAPTSPPISFV